MSSKQAWKPSTHNGAYLQDGVQLVHLTCSSLLYGAIRLRCINLQCTPELQKLEGLLQPPSKFAVRSGRIQAELVQDENIIGAINTSYTVGAVVAGFFFGGPLADWAGRRMGMAAGAVLVIIATFMQCFAPRGNIGVFIAGRVVIGLGQGLALSKQFLHYHESSD